MQRKPGGVSGKEGARTGPGSRRPPYAQAKFAERLVRPDSHKICFVLVPPGCFVTSALAECWQQPSGLFRLRATIDQQRSATGVGFDEPAPHELARLPSVRSLLPTQHLAQHTETVIVRACVARSKFAGIIATRAKLIWRPLRPTGFPLPSPMLGQPDSCTASCFQCRVNFRRGAAASGTTEYLCPWRVA
jgi:hypothetical protein